METTASWEEKMTLQRTQPDCVRTDVWRLVLGPILSHSLPYFLKWSLPKFGLPMQCETSRAMSFQASPCLSFCNVRILGA